MSPILLKKLLKSLAKKALQKEAKSITSNPFKFIGKPAADVEGRRFLLQKALKLPPDRTMIIPSKGSLKYLKVKELFEKVSLKPPKDKSELQNYLKEVKKKENLNEEEYKYLLKKFSGALFE